LAKKEEYRLYLPQRINNANQGLNKLRVGLDSSVFVTARACRLLPLILFVLIQKEPKKSRLRLHVRPAISLRAKQRITRCAQTAFCF
jgi:hypothetical protein